jgi:hypothetical protein
MTSKTEITLSSTFGAKSRCPLCGSKIQLSGSTITRMFFWTYKMAPRRRRIRSFASSSMMSSIPGNNIFRTRQRIYSTNVRFHKNEKSDGEYFSDEMCITLCPKCLRSRGKTWAFKSSNDQKPEGINRRCKINYK